MKGLSSAAAVAAILVSGVESFAPPSGRVAIIAPAQRHRGVERHPSHLDRPTQLPASNNSDEDLPTDDAVIRPSRRSKLIAGLRRKSKPLALALLTATSLRFAAPSLMVPPAKASAPIVLRANKKKDDPPMVVAEKKAEELRKQKSLEEFDRFMERCNDIEESEGKAARDAYEKQYQMEKEAAAAQKTVEVEKLKRSLLDKGQDPHTDLEAQRQVFLLEHDVDLEKVAGTPQNELMTKNFLKNRGKKASGEVQKSQRYIVACQVADVKARGIDPMDYFGDADVIEKTRAIYKMDDKVAGKVAAQYETLMAQHGGRLTPAKEGEVPFVFAEDAVASTAGAVAGGATATEGKAAARAAAKAERAAEREAARAAKAEARAKAQAEKAAAKEARLAEKAAAKEAKLAEKAAGAAVAAGAKEAAAVASSIADDDVAATANGDVFATAGNNAGENDAAAAKAVTQQKDASKGDLVETIKSYATVRNGATVLVGAGALKFGLDYYQENSASAQSERERQLKLILGNELEDDDEDDDEDEFDDDEDDDYAQFTKKKPAPPTAEPKTEAPKASKPAPSPPPAPKPAPKPKRSLGIFSKRNADKRETDLNSLVAPNAQAPEFASLLAKILTFGAPGRFPEVASWGAMPFSEFDLEKAKALLTESRGEADLTDEQSAEIFASVVNCMIIDIVDLASSTLKGKNKDDKKAVDAINVVMDFMDHAASLFDAVAENVTIKPVTYGGKLRKKDLEAMFSVYAGGSMMSLDGTGTSQDRVDTLQLVFDITDKKAEGLMQKHMMKMMMNLMKDGGKGLEDMPGLEGMEDMMKAMGGMEGMEGMGLPGMDGELSPEDLKQTVGMMKELMDSGQVSDEELAEVRKQFKDMYGSDISDLIKKATDEGAEGEMTDDERELLAMFKQILGED